MAKQGKHQRSEHTAAASGICFEPLEPRLLLSGSWGAGAEAPSADTPGAPGSEISPAGVDFHLDRGHADAAAASPDASTAAPVVDLLVQAPALNAIPTEVTNMEAAARTPSSESSSPEIYPLRELVFVDAGIRDYARLVEDLLAQTIGDTDFEVIVLDAGIDGIAQISEALAQRQGLDAVHFVSHGGDGAARLGPAQAVQLDVEQATVLEPGAGVEDARDQVHGRHDAVAVHGGVAGRAVRAAHRPGSGFC